MIYRVSLVIHHKNLQSFVMRKVVEITDDNEAYLQLVKIARDYLSYVKSQPSFTFLDDLNRIIFIKDASTTTCSISFAWKRQDDKDFSAINEHWMVDLVQAVKDGIPSLFVEK